MIRYDSLRATVATRASFILSADAVLIAGVALLVPQGIQRNIAGGRASLGLIGLGSIITLVLAGLSIRSAFEAQFGNRPWRRIFGDEAPSGFIYQHTDTLRETPSYGEFASLFATQTPQQELESAVSSLWVGLNSHARRYRFMRKSASRLYLAMSTFVLSVACAIFLIVIAK